MAAKNRAGIGNGTAMIEAEPIIASGNLAGIVDCTSVVVDHDAVIRRADMAGIVDAPALIELDGVEAGDAARVGHVPRTGQPDPLTIRRGDDAGIGHRPSMPGRAKQAGAARIDGGAGRDADQAGAIIAKVNSGVVIGADDTLRRGRVSQDGGEDQQCGGGAAALELCRKSAILGGF